MRPFTQSRGPALFLGLALAGFAAAAVTAQTTADPAAPLRCEITLEALSGGTRIAGRVSATHAVSGTYEMQITSRMGGGRSSISQSGDFTARPGAPADLGETEMFGAPAAHTVELQIHVGHQRLTCAEPAL